ncbi:hypothetical protein [Mucilaginibacter auburnensis]|uniref:Uncharacterized protein n=1 Tax=Mucilaginibacter auburnensis TaxID=1457233 RepID=A0A2H9VTK4_9SPHI|nr:hypothetical protein [Mucilaginibacter auburnensis]PJJ84122.1 hypothetical protein CLV57_1126 [Mucilaginibacter auburnensis]
MKYLIILFFLMLSFQREKIETQNQVFNSGAIDTSKYAVIKYNKGEHFLFFGREELTPALITPKELTLIDSILKKKAQKYNNQQKKWVKGQALPNDEHPYPLKNYFSLIGPLSKYYKQVIPIINSKNEKEVWVNCFCSKPYNNSWKSNIMYTLDGGACFFNMKINLTTLKISDLNVNGIA